MRGNLDARLTNRERVVIGEIRSIRRDVAAGLVPALNQGPARLVYDLIAKHRGHVELHLAPIAAELGVAMKTLQRQFQTEFGMTMKDHQIEARLAYARHMLSQHPRPKLSVIAKKLGYARPNEFERLFRRHLKTIPSEWRNETQE